MPFDDVQYTKGHYFHLKINLFSGYSESTGPKTTTTKKKSNNNVQMLLA